MNYLNHSPITCYFAKNARNFIVEEIPLYPFSGSGEHVIIKVRKKDLTTQQALQILSENLHVKIRDIGYAGLKDKHALSMQYFSIHKNNDIIKNLETLSVPNLKILDITYHNNKLKIGHLKGNKFFIRLKKLDSLNAMKLQEAVSVVAKHGMPNYFGAQRFGIDGENFKQGKAILEQKLRLKNKRISQFLISAFQSHLFNEWLKKRIEFSIAVNSFSPQEIMSKYPFVDSGMTKILKNQAHFFKILSGDIMSHYPHGALFINEDSALQSNADRFCTHSITPTGILHGAKVKIAQDSALEFEKHALDSLLLKEIGQRRFAWVFVENLEFIYKKDIANGELHFALPKGSYATILLETLLNKTDICDREDSSEFQ